MLEYYENDYDRVFSYLVRLKRGLHDISKDGVFYKDLVYVNGYLKVQKYIEQG